jgi:glyoxylase-like metal-dependent hydrolase (beta-lactamase superfamily II)
MTQDRLYIRQLLAGRDIADEDPVAVQMRNFVYLVGDREARQAVLVDPAWDVAGALRVAQDDGMEIVGTLATHHHPDHVGGSLMGHQVQGIAALRDHLDVPVHVQRDESRWVTRGTDVEASQLVEHDSGDVLEVGSIRIELLHTPGHTPGSQCFLVEDRYLVSGDTLFIDGCGRTDLPGGDTEALYHSLHKVLAGVPDEAQVLPGHLYSPQSAAPLAQVRERNVAYRASSLEQFVEIFGAG